MGTIDVQDHVELEVGAATRPVDWLSALVLLTVVSPLLAVFAGWAYATFVWAAGL